MPPPAPMKPQIIPMTTPPDDRLKGALLSRDPLHGFFGGHNGLDDEFNAQQECHKYRKAAMVVEGTRLATQLPTTVNSSTLAIMIRPFLISRFLFLW